MKYPALITLLGASLALAGCDKSGTSYSTLASSDSFSQAAATVNNKIDILWVVDNSGSMDPLQANLTANFKSFSDKFQSQGFDFQMGVTTTDAYLAGSNFANDSGRSMLRDGATINGVSNHSGYPIITNATPNVSGTFLINGVQGSAGSGDERAFSSMVETLNNPVNASFHRTGAFLAVIILSDEDDFSDATGSSKAASRAEGGGTDHNYSNSNLMKVTDLISYLDNLTLSSPTSRMYNVSAITVMDSACLASHSQTSTSSIMGTRYIALANQTSGIVGSVCDASYASSLNFIQQQIAELATQFRLTRTPVASSIQVTSNGVVVPQDPNNGWTYNSSGNAIVFHGTSVPSASAKINISFQPTSIN